MARRLDTSHVLQMVSGHLPEWVSLVRGEEKWDGDEAGEWWLVLESGFGGSHGKRTP